MKKRFQNRCFPVNIEKFLRLTFYNTLVAAASGSNCSELYKFLDGYFFNLQKCLFKIFPVTSETIFTKKKQPSTFRKH